VAEARERKFTQMSSRNALAVSNAVIRGGALIQPSRHGGFADLFVVRFF
tara:strand:- start:151 stop:297 length:147 start_codon:yes stop_codon:yes gene_type:complete